MIFGCITKTMREIKFRAWDKTRNRMFSGDPKWVEYRVDEDGVFTAQNYKGASGVIQQLEVMQYTGLKDANGVEIYEGDICKNYDCLAPVVFRNAGFFYAIARVNANSGAPYTHYEPVGSYVGPWRVVGNIYENPEILATVAAPHTGESE
jgi:uncharacterized phage protein (TIGR01671 family)